MPRNESPAPERRPPRAPVRKSDFAPIDADGLRSMNAPEAWIILGELNESKLKNAYSANQPVRSSHPVYPQLFSEDTKFEMRRSQLQKELQLILEMRSKENLADDTYIYSIQILEPAPFQPSEELQMNLQHHSESTAVNVRAGYLVHDALYSLAAQEGRLLPLIEAFLGSATKVAVKLRREPDAPRAVVVCLTD